MSLVEQGGDGDEEDSFNYGYNFEFSEKTIRMGFIRKVYGILLCQLLVTFGIIAMFIYIEPLQNYSEHGGQWMWIFALVLTFVLIIVLACCPDVRRTYPLNLILLAVFTLAESWLLGAVSSHYEAWQVLLAVGIVAVVSLSLTIFAFQTKIDFTLMGGLGFAFLIILLCYGLMCAIIRNYYLTMFYSALGACVFSFYIVYDTQLMLGGKHAYALSPEEYIFAALNLYLDIINLFLYVLAIVGGSSKK